MKHEPVLLDSVVRWLRPAPGSTVVDGTVGTGGHAEALLDRGATVVGIDRDRDALAAAAGRLEVFGPRFIPRAANYADLPSILENLKVPVVDGILLDLGVSSLQLDDASRGFSFRFDAPLDLRMDRTGGRPAGELLDCLGESELERVFREYGEERYARRIAKAVIMARRGRREPWRTRELGELCERAVPRHPRRRVHPATRVFQALRIAVNDELSHFSRFLLCFDKYLRGGGRVALLSYHSLEDRLAKRALRDKARAGALKVLTKRPERPSREEVERNPRSRSAKLRVAEKV